MRVAFFEDRNAVEFGPVTQLRPVFELLCGHYTLRERVIRTQPVTEWGAFLRDMLVEFYQEQHPEAHVNAPAWLKDGPTLFINGCWLADATALSAIEPGTVGVIDGAIVYLTVEPAEAALFDSEPYESALYQIARARRRVPASGRLVTYPWELVEHNPAQIAADFADCPIERGWTPPTPQVALVGPPECVAVDRTVQIDPFVVLDATRGPVSIEAGATIESFTRVEGPCHIRAGAKLYRASVRGGTTIGPACRVGSEVEKSILHGYVNKYHEGFLGHSYICPWVNLGALSTTSDLKNDYSAVRVPLEGKSLDTGLVKVGCFIGDHTKTGLGSLFNSGSSIGVMCMILPGGELLPRHIPSFTAVWHGELADALPVERSLAAARAAMNRRNCELTHSQERLLRQLYDTTQAERDEAIALFRERRSRLTSSLP
jgi:UDP-N-acetylglucosamine diphosphorylase/glucosamine-1-phosphate N-acetyltransferase